MFVPLGLRTIVRRPWLIWQVLAGKHEVRIASTEQDRPFVQKRTWDPLNLRRTVLTKGQPASQKAALPSSNMLATAQNPPH